MPCIAMIAPLPLCCYIVGPNEAMVVQHCGVITSFTKSAGFHADLCCGFEGKKVSLKRQTLNLPYAPHPPPPTPHPV